MKNPIINIEKLSLPWKTQDPFIFCSYHFDMFPGGNNDLSPNASLEGRDIGNDFAGIDAWNMYHGTRVPGFPAHPHSGFETVSIVTQGMVDHSDALGASGRFGNGDVQWLTSGKGTQHSEMFPLLNKDSNIFEIFQIWLNLPRKDKKVDPFYKMLWSEDIPELNIEDQQGKNININIIAGYFNNIRSVSPTPHSWAANDENHVQIWTIKMDSNAEFLIPPINEKVNRTLYFYKGDSFMLGTTKIGQNNLIELNAMVETKIINGSEEGFFLILQGRPINEEIIQYGPFVANTKQDLQETIQEYRKTQFGGWPWPTNDPVHDKNKGRFSIKPDGSHTIK